MNPLRTTVAFLLAPAVPAIAYCVPGIIFGGLSAGLFSLFGLVCTVTYAHAILLGIPTAFALNSMRRLTLTWVLGAAFLIGTLPYAALITYSEITISPGSSFTWNFEPHRIDGQLTRAGWVSMIDGFVMCGVLGLVTGIVWWWISGASANNALQPTRESAAERGR